MMVPQCRVILQLLDLRSLAALRLPVIDIEVSSMSMLPVYILWSYLVVSVGLNSNVDHLEYFCSPKKLLQVVGGTVVFAV